MTNSYVERAINSMIDCANASISQCEFAIAIIDILNIEAAHLDEADEIITLLQLARTTIATKLERLEDDD